MRSAHLAARHQSIVKLLASVTETSIYVWPKGARVSNLAYCMHFYKDPATFAQEHSQLIKCSGITIKDVSHQWNKQECKNPI